MFRSFESRAFLASLLIALAAHPLSAEDSGKELLDALARGDRMAVQRLVKSGARVNATDEFV